MANQGLFQQYEIVYNAGYGVYGRLLISASSVPLLWSAARTGLRAQCVCAVCEQDNGLGARSRHPNYFGEIVIWIGVVIIALPVLRGWQFVTLLLTRISAVPMLERRADEKWGGQEDYEADTARTPVLIPSLRSPSKR